MWFFVIALFVFLVIAWWFFLRPKEHVKYYVIHVKGNKERENNIQKMERILGKQIHRFDAIKGSSIHDDVFHKVRETSEKIYNKNELGCYMSHHQLIQKLSSEHTEYTVIFEDDFKVFPETHEQIVDIIKNFPDFDIIMLGNHSNTEIGQEVYKNVCLVHETIMIGGAGAYIVRNDRIHGYEKVLRNITAPIDLKIYNHIKAGDIDGYIRCPALISQNPLKSTLGH